MLLPADMIDTLFDTLFDFLNIEIYFHTGKNYILCDA